MKNKLIHNYIIRLFIPFIGGIISYLLILLIHNDLMQVVDYFVNIELYFCIAIAYTLHEISRAFLLWTQKNSLNVTSPASHILIQIFGTLFLSILICGISVRMFYRYYHGWLPEASELLTIGFVTILMPLLYCILYISEQYLNIQSKKYMDIELHKQNEIKEEFLNFKKGINPDLLFECLERLIVLNKENKEKADELIDQMSLVYRHILNNKDDELIQLESELKAVEYLQELFNFLPFRKIKLDINSSTLFKEKLIVPSALILTVQEIVKSLILKNSKADILVNVLEDHINISYEEAEKINTAHFMHKIIQLQNAYNPYTDQKVVIQNEGQKRMIQLPLLDLAG